MLNRIQLLLVLLASLPLAQADQDCRTDTIAATTPSSRFQPKDDGTVIDKQTGLMWRACVEGAGGEACGKGAPLELNWAEALLYVPELNGDGGFAGHKDWRLPNIRELTTLIELQCADPAINRAVFPGAGALHVWSASPARFHTHYSWYVDFGTGAFTYGERVKPKSVRLVRDAR